MEGSITQLGLGNYLINKKEKTESLFKQSTYENYANYVKHTKKLNFKTNAKFGSTLAMELDKEANYGDLISNLTLVLNLPSTSGLTTSTGRDFGYCNGVGNASIKKCDLKIGGNNAQQQDGTWMDIWGQLGISSGKQSNYKNMIKKSINHDDTYFQGGKSFTPLMFWFCQNTDHKHYSHILPLVSLRENTIELLIELRAYNDILYSTDGSSPTSSQLLIDAYLIVDYIILDEPDRASYLKQEHQLYLMHQVQTQTYDIEAGITNKNISLRNFKYPIVELFIVVRRDDNTTSRKYFNFSDSTTLSGADTPIDKLRLTFDGRDRIEELDAEIFTQVIPGNTHDNVENNFIHCITFALEPENIGQPTGSCNFSGIHEPMLHITFNSGIVASTLMIYALNYNVLQIGKDGHSWLLHNLSKTAPTSLNDVKRKNLEC